MEQKEIPLGFGMALAQNPDAMRVFSNFSEIRQSEILQKAHTVKSKYEMQSLVDNLSVQS